jgi:tetratricopeptide (TPR) repeat protein
MEPWHNPKPYNSHYPGISKGPSLPAWNITHQSPEALSCCDAALKLDPERIELWFNKATAEDYLGRKVDAIRSYQQVLNLRPGEYDEFSQHASRRIHELRSR